MAAPTVAELTSILANLNENIGAFGDPNKLDPTEMLALLAAGTRDETGVGSGIGETLGNEELFREFAGRATPQEASIAAGIFPDLFPTGGATPPPTGGLPPVAPGGASPPLTTSGTGELNVPFGSDFLDPAIQALLAGLQLQENARQFDTSTAEGQRQFNETMALANSQFTFAQEQFGLTFGEQQRQFDQGTLATGASMLANLRAQGPASAAELAFLQGGVFPGGQSSIVDISNLIGQSTRQAGGGLGINFGDSPQQAFNRLISGIAGGATPDQFGNAQVASAPAVNQAGVAGGPAITVPSTLGGAQLSNLSGNPNLAGVIQSFAQAAGNPDIFARSAAALLPSGFGGTGSGF